MRDCTETLKRPVSLQLVSDTGKAVISHLDCHKIGEKSGS